MSWSLKEQLGACERLVFGTSCQGNRLLVVRGTGY